MNVTRRPYRRKKAGRFQKWDEALGYLSVALVSLFGAAWGGWTLLAESRDWQALTAWIHGSEMLPLLALALLISAVTAGMAAQSLRQKPDQPTGPDGSDDHDRAERVFQAAPIETPRRRIAEYLFGLLGATMLGAGIVDYLVIGSSAFAFWAIGLGTVIVGLAVILRHQAGRPPLSVKIDRQGVHTNDPKDGSVTWTEITEINVELASDQECNPERDEIHLVFREGTVRRKRKQTHAIFPLRDLNVSPEVFLDALDRFRPSSVPIRDPRRTIAPEEQLRAK